MTNTPTCFAADGSCRGPLHDVHGDLWCSEHLRDLALDAIDHWARVLHALCGPTPAADVSAEILAVERAR